MRPARAGDDRPYGGAEHPQPHAVAIAGAPGGDGGRGPDGARQAPVRAAGQVPEGVHQEDHLRVVVRVGGAHVQAPRAGRGAPVDAARPVAGAVLADVVELGAVAAVAAAVQAQEQRRVGDGRVGGEDPRGGGHVQADRGRLPPGAVEGAPRAAQAGLAHPDVRGAPADRPDGEDGVVLGAPDDVGPPVGAHEQTGSGAQLVTDGLGAVGARRAHADPHGPVLDEVGVGADDPVARAARRPGEEAPQGDGEQRSRQDDQIRAAQDDREERHEEAPDDGSDVKGGDAPRARGRGH